MIARIIASDRSSIRLTNRVDARGAEAVGEDQPARLQVVDQDLAGQPLVGRGRVFDADAGQLGLQQLLDRQPAAAVRQADDDAVDVA